MKYSMVKIQIPGHKVMCTINLVDIPALVRCGLIGSNILRTQFR